MGDTNQAGTRDDVEAIVGLFLMAFGQGVHPLHVHRTAVKAIRAQLIPTISAAVQSPEWNTQWKEDAASVLGWMAAIGAMAAQIAMEPKDRRSVVGEEEFATAFQIVIAEHEHHKTLGKWCV